MPSLIDRYLPVFHFSEKHEIGGVASTPALIREAIRNFDDRRDPVLDALVRLREVPSRLRARLAGDAEVRQRERFGLKNFHVLEETPDEIAFALMGQFWRAGYGLARIADTPSFEAYRAAGSAKLVMTYSLADDADGRFTIRTETRVCCLDRRARIQFLPYWLAIRPASGWIRRRILRQLKAESVLAYQAARGRAA